MLLYGVKVILKQEEQDRLVVMKLNDTNFSFLELISESLKIVKSFCILEILGIYVDDLSTKIEVRLSDYE